MCLSTIYRGKEKKNALAALPKSGYYWKRVMRRKNDYYPSIMILPGNRPFRIGWNKTKKKYDGYGYAICFHIYRNRSSGRVRCIVKKKDIVAIGKQWGQLVIVTKRFWMPKPH